MKKDNSWIYAAGILASFAGLAGAMALRKRKIKSVAKSQIIRSLLVGRHWCVTKIKKSNSSSVQLSDLLLFVPNGMMLDLGSRDKFKSDQLQYDNMGAWTLYGRLLEVKLSGPVDYMAYKWEVEVINSERLRLRSALSEDIFEITAVNL